MITLIPLPVVPTFVRYLFDFTGWTFPFGSRVLHYDTFVLGWSRRLFTVYHAPLHVCLFVLPHCTLRLVYLRLHSTHRGDTPHCIRRYILDGLRFSFATCSNVYHTWIRCWWATTYVPAYLPPHTFTTPPPSTPPRRYHTTALLEWTIQPLHTTILPIYVTFPILLFWNRYSDCDSHTYGISLVTFTAI